MEFDYRKLKGRIIEKYGSQSLFADKMGLSERTISLKMNGKRAWSQPEISKALSILSLDEDDIGEYFFREKVQ